MKIIYQGTVSALRPDIWWIGLRGTCSYCGGVIELDDDDALSPDNEWQLSVRCPTEDCRGTVFFLRLHFNPQPTNQTVTTGSPVTFSSQAWGQLPIAYQWYKKYAVIPGATSKDYTIASAQPSDAGIYCVKAECTNKSVTSNVVTLTVT